MEAKKRQATIAVVVIIVVLAILAAIAIPAWRNHQISKRVDTAAGAVDAAKLVVMEAATTHGGLAKLKAGDLDYNAANLANDYVSRIVIGNGGSITLTTTATGASPDLVMQWTPYSDGADTALVLWKCTVVAGDASLAPADCRDTQPSSTSMPPAPAATTAGAASSASQG